MESVILNNPIIIIGFVISLALGVFAIVKKVRFAVTVISAVIFSATLTYALLKGADLYEAGAVAAVFFIINLFPLWKNDGADK